MLAHYNKTKRSHHFLFFWGNIKLRQDRCKSIKHNGFFASWLLSKNAYKCTSLTSWCLGWLFCMIQEVVYRSARKSGICPFIRLFNAQHFEGKLLLWCTYNGKGFSPHIFLPRVHCCVGDCKNINGCKTISLNVLLHSTIPTQTVENLVLDKNMYCSHVCGPQCEAIRQARCTWLTKYE